MSIHFHTREGKRWGPTQSIPWLGFVANAGRGVVEIDAGKLQRGMALREAASSLPSGSTLPARTALPTVSFLNFLQWVAPGGFIHLRRGRNVVNKSGRVGDRRGGVRQADCPETVSSEFRYDTCW